jgi:hypothetical protein
MHAVEKQRSEELDFVVPELPFAALPELSLSYSDIPGTATKGEAGDLFSSPRNNVDRLAQNALPGVHLLGPKSPVPNN